MGGNDIWTPKPRVARRVQVGRSSRGCSRPRVLSMATPDVASVVGRSERGPLLASPRAHADLIGQDRRRNPLQQVLERASATAQRLDAELAQPCGQAAVCDRRPELAAREQPCAARRGSGHGGPEPLGSQRRMSSPSGRGSGAGWRPRVTITRPSRSSTCSERRRATRATGWA